MKGINGKKLSPKEEKKAIRQGLSAGLIGMGTGLALHGVRKIADKHANLLAASRTLKVAAPTVAGIGATLAGVSAYKHFKNKKKSKKK